MPGQVVLRLSKKRALGQEGPRQPGEDHKYDHVDGEHHQQRGDGNALPAANWEV
jgi:hypothetical protein